MEKKTIFLIGLILITIVGITSSVILLSQNISDDQKSDNPQNIKADVIMPTKVSRPGCENTDSCYIPSKIEIKKGESVTWVNQDAAFHSVTAGSYGEPSELFDSTYLDPEESFTFIFENIGTYDYFCTLHPWMKGQVIVQ
ncbi:Blue (Type1) copper domain-containing protein [metagenome]